MSMTVTQPDNRRDHHVMGQKLLGFIVFAGLGAIMLVVSKWFNIKLNFGIYMKWTAIAFMAFVGANVTNTGLGGFITKMLGK